MKNVDNTLMLLVVAKETKDFFSFPVFTNVQVEDAGKVIDSMVDPNWANKVFHTKMSCSVCKWELVGGPLSHSFLATQDCLEITFGFVP